MAVKAEDVGAELRRVRAAGTKAKPCTGCGGFAILLREGLCKFCYDEKVYHA